MNNAITFKPATKAKAKLRLAISGPAGTGKTYTALKLATAFGKTAVIDTERGSASKYAGDFTFDVVELSEFNPQHYIDAIHAAENAGYDVVVIDSLSHAWNAVGGILEMVDKAAARSQSKNTYFAWKDVTPIHNALIEAIVGSSCHVIATMRSKSDYILEESVNSNGKKTVTPRKIGLAPIQREGMEFEFDVWGEMDTDNTMVITKTRCSALNGGVIAKPGQALAETLMNWLSDGVEPPVVAGPPAPANPYAAATGKASKWEQGEVNWFMANAVPLYDNPNHAGNSIEKMKREGLFNGKTPAEALEIVKQHVEEGKAS